MRGGKKLPAEVRFLPEAKDAWLTATWSSRDGLTRERAAPTRRRMRRTHHNVPSIDQSDRLVPVNLRQSGRTPVEMLVSTRVRKSPYWHLSVWTPGAGGRRTPLPTEDLHRVYRAARVSGGKAILW